uniref:Uncharacterized protein n=1 Tax=Oryza rufipogon TaxID=4529 RepID=A0A0E0N757_ORYRU
MPTGAMKRLFVESSSSAAASNSGREAAVLCAPRPRRVQVHPCSADLILGPPPFLLSSNNTNKQREGKSKEEEEEEGRWEMFGGSPPARADNPLVHDPHFLLNQRPHAAAAAPELSIFDHRSTHHGHHPAYSSSSSFAPSLAAARVAGVRAAACCPPAPDPPAAARRRTACPKGNFSPAAFAVTMVKYIK